jgi:hypothetical protein
MFTHRPYPVWADATSIGEAERAAPRQCGRCRNRFDGNATVEPGAIPDWWLCPPCRAILLPGHAGTVVSGRAAHAV